MEGCAHNTLGHGRLELAAKLAHFHLEIPQHIVLLLPCSFSDESRTDPDPDPASQCCGYEFLHSGSEFFFIPNPGSASKNWSILTQNVSKLLEIQFDPCCLSRIQILTFTHPRTPGQKGTGTHTQHCSILSQCGSKSGHQTHCELLQFFLCIKNFIFHWQKDVKITVEGNLIENWNCFPVRNLSFLASPSPPIEFLQTRINVKGTGSWERNGTSSNIKA